jgi:hypothetical protein
MDEFKTKHFIRCTPATDKPIVGAANQWNSHVIVHSDVMKSLIYTASPNLSFVVEA